MYSPRTYIYSSGDAMSLEKAVAFERNITHEQGEFDFVELPRARKVGQSYASSIGTTLSSFATAFQVLTIAPLRAGGRRWEVVLLNGPGTCVVVAFALMLPRVSLGNAILRAESVGLTHRLQARWLALTSCDLRRILGSSQVAVTKWENPQTRRRQVRRAVGRGG